MPWRVYVDEAGDRGIAQRSSRHFVMSAVIVKDGDDSAVRAELSAMRAALGRDPAHVLHFQKFSHAQRLKACQDLCGSRLSCVTSVILCKRGFTSPQPDGTLAFITNPDPMYLWAVRLLLERVSWYVRDQGGGPSIVTFAHVRRFPKHKLHDYRGALERSTTNIWWPSFEGHPFRIESPGKIENLQLADIAASALFRAIEPDEFGNVEPRYLNEILPKVYRRGAASISSYGLKVFPNDEVRAGGSLAHLAAL